MRVVFYASEKPREQELASAFRQGCRAGSVEHGNVVRDTCDIRPPSFVEGYDVAAMVGVKSRELWRACLKHGVVPIMFDKGYTRHRRPGSRVWEYWRVSVGAHQPTKHLMGMRRPFDRLNKLELPFKPWRDNGRHIVLAGSSAKYHQFHGLPEPTFWSQRIIRDLHSYCGRPIIYRPKPSWRDAAPVTGSDFSHDGRAILADLQNAWALVTHGSSACLEAVLEGIPCIVLGDAVARPISSANLAEIVRPQLATDKRRRQWLANLAYCQWTIPEMESGRAWREFRPTL